MRTLATSPTPVSSSDSVTSWQPLARQDHLVKSQVGDEVVVYDETSHAIHHLNPTSQAVWFLCDGTRTPASIGQMVGVTLGAEVSEDIVRLALGQLTAAELLVGATPAEIGQPRHTRRSVLRRLALAGGVALPVLVSVSAPSAVHATSHCVEVGEPYGQPDTCCSGCYGLGVCALASECPPG